MFLMFSVFQVGGNGIQAAWAGGKNGREVMDRIFPLVPKLLSPKGFFYLLVLKENNPGEIIYNTSCYDNKYMAVVYLLKTCKEAELLPSKQTKILKWLLLAKAQLLQ